MVSEPLPPEAGMFTDVGENEIAHTVPSWSTVTTLPVAAPFTVTAIDPPRFALLAATDTGIVTDVLVLDPDCGPKNVMNDPSPADTLHVQPLGAVKLIENDPLPPALAKKRVGGSVPPAFTLLKAHCAFAGGAA
jgi:hypothetical protein